jgi:hypothetical protein
LVKYFLFIFFSLSSLALQHNEELNVKIIERLKSNIFVLSRGSEDEVKLKDHIKLISVEHGFSARGICIKAENKSSHFKMYRLVDPKTLSSDITYTMLSINDSQMPKELRKYVRDSFLSAYAKKQ